MMALSSKRPSQRDEIKSKLLNDVTETNEKKRRLNAEIEDSLYRASRVVRPKKAGPYPASPAIYGLSI